MAVTGVVTIVQVGAGKWRAWFRASHLGGECMIAVEATEEAATQSSIKVLQDAAEALQVGRFGQIVDRSVWSEEDAKRAELAAQDRHETRQDEEDGA